MAAEGDSVHAGVEMWAHDQFGNDVSINGVLLGQQVRLVSTITEDLGNIDHFGQILGVSIWP